MLILPDIHSQNVDKKAFGCVMNYAAKHKWDDVVQLGDLIEGDSVSAHNKGKPKLLEGERLQHDFTFANGLLNSIIECANPKEFHVLKGNHEYRVDRYIDEHPELDGLINVERGLCLDQRDINFVDCYPGGQTLKIGKLHFTHGRYTGGNPCKKHLDVFGVNIVFGHTHEVGIYSKVTWGKGKAISAYNLGCLCRYDAGYLEGAPTNWQHAFGTVYIQRDGKFNLTIHNIFNGVCVVDGKRYSYRD